MWESVMKGLIRIKEKSEYDVFKYEFNDMVEDFDYVIDVAIENNEKFKDIINTSGDAQQNIDIQLDIMKGDNSIVAKESVKSLLRFSGKTDKYLKECENVIVDLGDINKTIDYINNNPDLKEKTIIFDKDVPLDYTYIDLFKKRFDKSILDKISLLIDGNIDYIDFNTYEKTIDNIYSIYSQIKELNLSTFENIMVIYDIVKGHIYNKEEESEDKTKSRSLSNVLLGDKIVCVGFSKLFKVLLKMLNIKSHEIFLSGEVNHERNLVYVKDPKYNIDGVYYFDSTWDSKIIDEGNYYLLKYKYFAKTKKEMILLDKGKNMQEEKLDKLDLNLADKFEKIAKEKGLSSLPKKIIDEINFMSLVVNDRYLLHRYHLYKENLFYDRLDINKTKEEIERLVKLFNKKISAETYLLLLYNIRKTLYYINNEEEFFNLDSFYKSAVFSKWEFEREYVNILYAIFKEEKYKNTYKDDAVSYFSQNKIPENIERVKLTKTLRKIYEKRSE